LTPSSREATGHSLLTATASVICLLLAATLRLAHTDLAVWTTFLVMAQYTYTSFQKGFERVAGRGVGILAGLVLTTWFNDVPLVAFLLIGVLLTACFYIYFSGRLAYTALQAGLYLVAVFQIGRFSPETVEWESRELFAAILVGVFVANIVNWLAGFEGDVSINLGDAPLFPVRTDWLNQSLMLAVTVLITLVVAHLVDLPPTTAAISVLVLTISPHLQALIQKGELRIAGLVLATLWSAASFVLVGLLPHFPLLATFVFLGQFVATYLTLRGGTYSYAGLQMGLVLPMIAVAAPDDFGSLLPALQRLEGILLGLGASVIVAGLWPRFPLAAAPPLPPPVLVSAPVAMPGEMDV
jgi:uncharacterized membrane protein YccC